MKKSSRINIDNLGSLSAIVNKVFSVDTSEHVNVQNIGVFNVLTPSSFRTLQVLQKSRYHAFFVYIFINEPGVLNNQYVSAHKPDICICFFVQFALLLYSINFEVLTMK